MLLSVPAANLSNRVWSADADDRAGPRQPRYSRVNHDSKDQGFFSKAGSSLSKLTRKLRGSDEPRTSTRSYSTQQTMTSRADSRTTSQDDNFFNRLVKKARAAGSRPSPKNSPDATATQAQRPTKGRAVPPKNSSEEPPWSDAGNAEFSAPEPKPLRSTLRDAAPARPIIPAAVLLPESTAVRLTSGAKLLSNQGWNAVSDDAVPNRGSIRTAGLDEQQDAEQPPRRIRIPINDLPGRVQIRGDDDHISLQVSDAPVSQVLALIAQQNGFNIVTGESVDGSVSVNLTDVRIEDALDVILTANGYTWSRQRNIIVVTKIDKETSISPNVQGRVMRVFPLTYVKSDDIDVVVKGLLSPVGQSFVTTSSTDDQRKTGEQLVVEDLPEYLDRIASYVAKSDIPPRQVLIEAHVLRVDLEDDLKHGVDIGAILNVANADVVLRTAGFASPTASPAFFFGIDGTDLDALLEALQTTTNAKTLASPKVSVVNGQEAKIQIGERLGYLTTTTTQTSTLQEVNFLETGIVMTVTPVIGSGGRILMKVMPKISTGRVNPDTGLPEEETTDVRTTVMLDDGQAMVIGGLITEGVTDLQSKVPIVGDLWGVGRLFQRRSLVKTRSEIIIALIPRLVPYDPEYQSVHELEKARVATRLTEWPLQETNRDFEPELPDARRNPRKIRWDRILHGMKDVKRDYPRQSEYFFPSTLDPWYYDIDE